MLVEDLHWAEEPLLDLFERLLRDVHGPVFLLGTARPELLGRRPAWAGGRRNAASLWLEPLSQDETAELVESLLGTELAPRSRELVLGRAEGNPFFVEELLATLIDAGAIARENGGWVARELASEPVVPDSVQATLASRIDLLPAREKAALQAAVGCRPSLLGVSGRRAPRRGARLRAARGARLRSPAARLVARRRA